MRIFVAFLIFLLVGIIKSLTHHQQHAFFTLDTIQDTDIAGVDERRFAEKTPLECKKIQGLTNDQIALISSSSQIINPTFS